MFGLAKEAFEFHGNVQVKLEFYLDPADYGYDKTYIDVPDFTGQEYKGKKDKEGNPDPETYQEWINKLPKKKQLNPFHNHFIYLPPEYTKADIENEIAFHLPNFYKAWSVGKSMRSGWATEKRVRPVRFDKVHPELYAARKEACLGKIASLAEIRIKPEPADGKAYPATDIDVGSAAIDRVTTCALKGDLGKATGIDYNNPANDSGVIDTVEAWFGTADAGNNFRVGIFDNTSSANFTCRDGVSIGSVSAGSKQTYTGLSLDVETGDYIGGDGYNSTGNLLIERALSGGGGLYYSVATADNSSCFCDQGDTTGTLSLYSGDILSLYGSGETAGGIIRHLGLLGVGA